MDNFVVHTQFFLCVQKMRSLCLLNFSLFVNAVVVVIVYLQVSKGKRNLESKRKKRRVQKARKRKKFSQRKKFSPAIDNACSISTGLSLQPNVVESPDLSSQPLSNECSSSMTCGEDLVALEMRLEDSLKKKDEIYSYEYLLESRQRLCGQVERYREEVERLSSALTKQSSQHRVQLDHVRDFYRTIAYSQNRSGKMVKMSLEKSSPAAELMKELEAQYGSNSDTFM